MSQATVTPTARMRDSAFGALAAAILGLALLEIGWTLLRVHALVHTFSLLVGGALIALMGRRFVQYWPTDRRAAAQFSHGRQYQKPRVFWAMACALVAAAGYVAAETLASGLVSFFVMFAFALTFLPWTKFAQTRAHCLGYGTASFLGISAALLLGYPGLNPFLLVAVTWLLWMTTIAAWLRIVVHEKRQQRSAAVTTAPPRAEVGNEGGILGAEAAEDAVSDAYPRNRAH